MTVDELNDLSEQAFVDELVPFVKGVRWPVEAALAERPFTSVRAIHEAIFRAVTDAGDRARCDLIEAFPCHLPQEGDAPAMPDNEESEPVAWSLLASRYRARIGFGFVIAKPPNRETELRRLVEERTEQLAAEERVVALREISQMVFEGMDEHLGHAVPDE